MTNERTENSYPNGLPNHPIWALAFKRFMDVVFSLFALCALLPVFLVVSAGVKFSSPGPVFYRGLRGGHRWQPFRILKFRTMVNNAELLGGPTTGTNDPRVTRFGRFLRRSKLDELPQFINVFGGHMSLVGPRPEVLEYTIQYKGEERFILAMRPGITDYSSIEFADLDDRVGNDNPDAYFRQYILPRKNFLRLKYVTEWSIASDFRIFWLTFLRVIQRVLKK